MNVFRQLPILCLLLLVALLTGSSVSCQSQEPAPATPAPENGLPTAPSSGEPLPPSSESWSSDGVIGTQEYLGEMAYDGYELYWINDGEFVYFAIKAKTTGWVALGIQPGSKMKGADMIFGSVSDGEAVVIDSFGVDNFGSHPPDTELGGTADILEFGGSEADGYTIIEFKRALDTGDPQDIALSIGDNNIIWSYGSGDTPTTKHQNRGYGEITLNG